MDVFIITKVTKYDVWNQFQSGRFCS